MKKIFPFISGLIFVFCGMALADNYGKIRTDDANSQNIDKWKEASGILEMTEKWEGQVYLGEDKKKVTLMRNIKTGKLTGSDAWGNIYEVLGNTDKCGKVIDQDKETAENVEMTNKWEGRAYLGEDKKKVTLMRNIKTGKLTGSDAWGNIYEVLGNTDKKGKIIDSTKEIKENLEIVTIREKPITRNGRKVMLTREKRTGKLSGRDAWGNCYGVPNNTSSDGKILDLSKEAISNVEILK